jgi:hypothetical protein
MTVYKNAKCDTYCSEGVEQHVPLEVKIENGSIAVSYKEDGILVVYEGRENEPGHFELERRGISSKATLHRFHDDDVLEGSWREDRYEGMWRIELGE